MTPPPSDPAGPRAAPTRPAGRRLAPRIALPSLAVLADGPQRAVILAAAAAVVGLGIAGAVAFRPIARPTTTVPAGIVALVNQEPILMSDFVNETETLEGVTFAETTAAQRAKVLHDMINEELLVQRGLVLDLPEQDTGARTALVDGMTALVAAPVLAQTPSEDQLRAYYLAHRAHYATMGSMTLTDLVIHVGGFENAAQTVDQALADAAQAVFELRSGSNLDYVKDHYALTVAGDPGEIEPDFSAKLHLGQKLFDVAAGMGDGEISQPVATADGVHVLIMGHREAPIFSDFEAVRNNVYADYIGQEKELAARQNINFLRKNAQIILAPGQKE